MRISKRARAGTLTLGFTRPLQQATAKITCVHCYMPEHSWTEGPVVLCAQELATPPECNTKLLQQRLQELDKILTTQTDKKYMQDMTKQIPDLTVNLSVRNFGLILRTSVEKADKNLRPELGKVRTFEQKSISSLGSSWKQKSNLMPARRPRLDHASSGTSCAAGACTQNTQATQHKLHDSADSGTSHAAGACTQNTRATLHR
jgi:hypothetical protein